MNDQRDYRGIVGYAGGIKVNPLIEEFTPPNSPEKIKSSGTVLNGLVGYAGFHTVVPNGIQDVINCPESSSSNDKRSLSWLLKAFSENEEFTSSFTNEPSFEEMMDLDIPIPSHKPPELLPFCISPPCHSKTLTVGTQNFHDMSNDYFNLPSFGRSLVTPKKGRKMSSKQLLSTSLSDSDEWTHPVTDKFKGVNFSKLGVNEVHSFCELGYKYLPDGIIDKKIQECQNRRQKRLECTQRYRKLESHEHYNQEVAPMSGGLPKVQSIKWLSAETNDSVSSWLTSQSDQNINFVKSTSLERCWSLSTASSSVSPAPLSAQANFHSDSLSPVNSSNTKQTATSRILNKRKSLPIQSPNEVKPLVGWGEKSIPQPMYEAQLPLRQSCMSDRFPTVNHHSEEDYGFIFMRLLNIFKEDLVDLIDVLTSRDDKQSDSPNKPMYYANTILQETSPIRKTEFKSLRSLERPESRVKPVHPFTLTKSSSQTQQYTIPYNSRPCDMKGSVGHTVYENDQEVTLFRVGDIVIATDSKCPHAGGPLEVGDIENLYDGDCIIRCPWHGYKFNLFKSGEVVHPLSRKNDLRLRTYPVKIDETGCIYIGFEFMSQHWFDSSYS